MMYRRLFLYFAVVTILLIVSCKLCEEEPKPIEVYGCMDSTATNYNPEATIDDGSCDYCGEGSSFLLISTDGGETWEFNCPQDINFEDVIKISVIDSNHIWIANNKTLNNPNDQILFSSDKGKTWEVQFTFSNQDRRAGLAYIKMFDINNGIAVADYYGAGVVFYTTNDGGVNWTQVPTQPTSGSLTNSKKVDFIDMKTGYFLNTFIAPRIFYGTKNLGAPWDTTHFKTGVLLKFFNEDIGLLADHGNIHRTIDGGETWQKFPQAFFNDTFFGYGIQFSNITPKDVWLLDSQYIHFSSDTGRTWISYDVPQWNYDMYVYNNKSWVIGGPTLLYSESATGGIWDYISYPNQPLPIKMFPEAIGGYKDEIIVMTGSF